MRRHRRTPGLSLTFAVIVILVTISGCGWRPQFWTFSKEEREPDNIQDVINYNIQLGLFDSQEEAEVVANSARRLVTENVRVVYKPPFYRVWIEAGLPENEADEMIGLLREKGFSDARRIFENNEY